GVGAGGGAGGRGGGGERARRDQDTGHSKASHSGSPSLSDRAGKVMRAPPSRAASTASPTAPISGASDGNRAGTSSGGNGTPARSASCRPGRSRSQDPAIPPPTAIRSGLRQIARLTTWYESSATNSETSPSRAGSCSLAANTPAAVRGSAAELWGPAPPRSAALARVAARRAKARPLTISSSTRRRPARAPTSSTGPQPQPISPA